MYRLDRFNRKHTYLKDAMPFARIVGDPAIVLNKDGSIQTTFAYRGPDLGSAIKEQLAIITQQLNAAIMAMDTGWVLYFEAQRKASTKYATDVYFPDPITKLMDDERRAFFSNGQHFESDYFCTLYWMPPSDQEGRIREFVVEGKKKRQNSAEDNIDAFSIVCDKLFSLFNALRIPCRYLSQDEMLTYLHSTVSTSFDEVHMPKHNLFLDNYLYDEPLYGGLEPRLGKSHIRVVTPIGYLTSSVFGLFDPLNQMDFPYRWITRYFCLEKQDAMDVLQSKKKGWYGKLKSINDMIKELVFNKEGSGQVNQAALMHYNEADESITAVETDITTYGFYTTAIVVMDEDSQRADDKAKTILQTLANIGFRAKVEDLNAIDAWLGTIPGNVGRNIRRPILSSGNLIHMMPISDIWAGAPRNKHLGGPPLIYTQTTGNTPFRLNLHVGDVGHTLVVGPTGAGKSVELNIIAASWRKYKDARVFIFDKGASSKVLTYGVGGNFFDLGNEGEGALSFQPLAHVEDPKEQQWVLEWLLDYARQENLTITPEIRNLLLDAIEAVASIEDPRIRRMTTLVNFVQSIELKDALRPLTVDGVYGRIFDSDTDNLQISSWQTFEMEKLMQTKAIVGPTLMYIFHRIEESLTGAPTIIILDECWVFFDNEQFAAKIREWLKVLRKANAAVIFATQSLTDIVESPIFSTVLESCPSQIFLPNDKALEETSKAQYMKFGLNQRQVEIIASAIKKKQYYYVSPMGSRLYDLALEACPVSLAYVAVNKKDTQKADEIMEQYGPQEFNKHWLEYRNVTIEEDEPERKKLF